MSVGQNKDKSSYNNNGSNDNADYSQNDKPFPNISMPENLPVLYSDFFLVYSNDSGVVLNFAQSTGPVNQQNIVARIGVSKEYAKKIIEVLKKQVNS